MMRANEDYIARRVVIKRGKYKSKKGFVAIASKFGIHVDLDYKPLRVMVSAQDILLLDDYGQVDKILK